MNVQHTRTAVAESRERHSYARVPRHWLLLARGGWGALVIFTLTPFIASLPVYVTQLQTLCPQTACEYQQPTPSHAEVLKGMGLSLLDYAALTLAFALACVVLCLALSTLIIWRKPDDRMALIVALMLVTLGPIIVVSNVTAPPPWGVLDQCLTYLTGFLLVLVFLLFPTGRFVPHWTGFLLIVFLVGGVSSFFDTPLLPQVVVGEFSWLFVVAELTMVAAVQLYRYRRVSGPRERQQTKWVVFGLAVPISVFVLATVLSQFPLLFERTPLLLVAYNEAGFAMSLFLPLAFGVAILRARLWDIDRIINRTLVYSTLTLSLAAVYVGLVIGLSALLRGLISQDNAVALVLSTLVIYTLFQPLRAGIQVLIDRRFYRRKYDAAKTLQAFSAILRQEVDLEQLREQLVAVVQETMQPTSVSLWLCQSHQEKRAGVLFSLGTQSNTSLEGRQSRDALIDGTNTIESIGLVKEESHG